MKVLNIRRMTLSEIPVNAVNIMRSGPMRLGNPFMIGVDGSREDVVRKHGVYLRARIQTDPGFRDLIKGLNGRDLLCCCAPAACHGDNIKLVCEELNQ